MHDSALPGPSDSSQGTGTVVMSVGRVRRITSAPTGECVLVRRTLESPFKISVSRPGPVAAAVVDEGGDRGLPETTLDERDGVFVLAGDAMTKIIMNL